MVKNHYTFYLLSLTSINPQHNFKHGRNGGARCGKILARGVEDAITLAGEGSTRVGAPHGPIRPRQIPLKLVVHVGSGGDQRELAAGRALPRGGSTVRRSTAAPRRRSRSTVWQGTRGRLAHPLERWQSEAGKASRTTATITTRTGLGETCPEPAQSCRRSAGRTRSGEDRTHTDASVTRPAAEDNPPPVQRLAAGRNVPAGAG